MEEEPKIRSNTEKEGELEKMELEKNYKIIESLQNIPADYNKELPNCSDKNDYENVWEELILIGRKYYGDKLNTQHFLMPIIEAVDNAAKHGNKMAVLTL